MDVRDAGLAVRTQNCLLAAGLETLEDIAALPTGALLGIPNLGRKATTEVETVLAAHGIKPVRSPSTKSIDEAILLLVKNGYRVDKPKG